MSEVWREWAYSALNNSVGLAVYVTSERIFGAGALRGFPAAGTPFLVINFGPDLEDIGVPTSSVTMDIACHDQQRTYKLIDVVLNEVRAAILAAVPPQGGFPALPLGRTPDQADDALDTLRRAESFRLIRIRETVAQL